MLLLCLRSEGLAQQVLSSLAKVKAGKDDVLAGCAAVTLLALSCEDAHPAYLASTAAALLMDQLLQVNQGGEQLYSYFILCHAIAKAPSSC